MLTGTSNKINKEFTSYGTISVVQHKARTIHICQSATTLIPFGIKWSLGESRKVKGFNMFATSPTNLPLLSSLKVEDEKLAVVTLE